MAEKQQFKTRKIQVLNCGLSAWQKSAFLRANNGLIKINRHSGDY